MTRLRLACLALFLLAPHLHAQDGWLLYRGNAQRTGAAPALAAWDKRPAWQRPLFMDQYQIGPNMFIVDPDGDAKKLFDPLLKGADPALLPSGFPLIVGGACVYRSYRDVRAVALQGMDIKDEKGKVVDSLKGSDIVWKSIPHETSLGFLLEKESNRASVDAVVKALQANKQEHFVWCNPTIGSISSDGKLVYCVSDFAFGNVLALDKKVQGLKPFLVQNDLLAYDAVTGKIMWESRVAEKSVLPDSLFLSAPLPHAGKLFVLNEKGTELRLVRIDLDWSKWKVRYQPDIDKSLVMTELPKTEQAIAHPMRRTQPLHIAVAGEMLVCPTNAGLIFGIDGVKMTERWQYRYREANAAVPALPHWQAAGAIVAKERIVFTAADSVEVHCIDFDGKKKWAAAPDKDLYLATVHDDLVLLAGKTHVRALNLADGTEKWKLEMGLPAGVGVRDGGIYYLPLKRDPAIWAIDIAKGEKVRRVNLPHPDAIGNLALAHGMLVSQSATHAAAFPLAPFVK